MLYLIEQVCFIEQQLTTGTFQLLFLYFYQDKRTCNFLGHFGVTLHAKSVYSIVEFFMVISLM